VTTSSLRDDQPLADAATGVLAVGSFLSGVLIGASGPVFRVVVIVALAGGPTWGGLALLGAIVVGAVSTLIVVIGLTVGHRSYLGVATVAACAALIAGIFVGTSYGSSARLGGWAAAYATPAPTPVQPIPSFATYLEAHADVTLVLDPAAGFASSPTTNGPDGTFGHWCRSGPDSTDVLGVSAMDAAHMGTSTLHADLTLEAPSLISPEDSFAYPRLVLQLGGPTGMTAYAWSGPARIVATDGPSGTIAFDTLVADPVPPGFPSTLSGQLSWTCRAWSAP
jgi:hypothetical protein